MAKERNVTRTIIESKTYEVYKKEGLNLTLLETIETKGKLSEKELAEKHKVDKVFINPVKENKVTYAMTVDEFMKYAKPLPVEGDATAQDEPQTQETK